MSSAVHRLHANLNHLSQTKNILTISLANVISVY